jgi:glycosyltransferase involved in cell wall biosynthesis
MQRGDKTRPRVILTLDNTKDDHVRRLIVERVKAAYLPAFDGFSVGGIRTRDYLIHLGVSPGRIQPGWCCVDNAQIEALVAASRPRAPLGPNDGYLLCVSRMVPNKNLPFLVHAYARYRRQLDLALTRWPLVIVGDGPDRQAVVDAIQSNGVEESVTLPGATSSLEDTCKYYANARAFVLPSVQNEPWGSVVNEAMAAALPVLVSERCGCAPDLVSDGANGFRFNPQDASDLAERIVWLHEHQSELQQMGRESQLIVNRYSPEQFASNVLALAMV